MSDIQCAPRMIDLRLAPAAAATWAATWWATGHPAQWAWIGACALVALGCAASYACSQRGRNTPRHALTPSRSARLGVALLLACVACALAVGSAARRQYDADPARRDSGPIHARVLLQADPAPASSGFSATRSARARIEAVSVGEEWILSNATAVVRAPGWQDAARPVACPPGCAPPTGPSPTPARLCPGTHAPLSPAWRSETTAECLQTYPTQ